MRDERQAGRAIHMRIRKGSGVAEGCMPCVFIYFCPIPDGRTDGRGVVVGAVRIAATVSDRDLGA